MKAVSYSGWRAAPLDPLTKVPKEKLETIARLEDPQQEKIPKFLSKNRSGFSGGFKIPEEQRKNQKSRKMKNNEQLDKEDEIDN